MTTHRKKPRWELQRKKPQKEKKDRKTTTHKDLVKKRDKNMPNVNQIR